MTPLRVALLVVAIVLASTPRVGADERVAAAVALWREGRELLQQKRYAEACDRFTRSHQLDPSAGALFNLGDCNEKQSKFASAWSAYTDSETLAASKPGAANQQHAKDAHDAAERVLPRVSRIKVVVEARAPGMTILRNGHPLESAALNVALPVDAGPQTISASAPDHRPWRTTIELGEGATETVRVPALEETPSAGIVVGPPPSHGDGGKTQRHVALGLEIGGGTFVVAGLALGGIAIAQWSSITDECANAICRTEQVRQARAADQDNASTFATLSTVSLAVGVVALAVGVVLHLTAPAASEVRTAH